MCNQHLKYFRERFLAGLKRDAVKDLMTLTETDITNICQVFVAIWSQVISAMMNGLVFPLGDNSIPLSNYIELCKLKVKTFIPHDILNIQHEVNLFGKDVHLM